MAPLSRRLLAALLLGLGAGLAAPVPALALNGGSPAPDGSWGFVAKVDVGGARACTGALVAPRWVVTVGACFASGGQPVAAGAPAQPTSVTLGRTDLTGSAGRVVPVVELVPHPDRDIVLARLAVRVTDIAPVTVTATAPTAGDPLDTAGYGRTATDWVPDRLHAAPVTVAAVSADAFTWTGRDDDQASACKGDAGGPVVRTAGGQPELAALDAASGQGGCLAETDPRHGATALRLDDLRTWITAHTPDVTGTFAAVFSSSTGIGRFDLGNAADQVVPFDYLHTGRPDHLIMYRPGAGVIIIARHNPDGGWSSALESATGISVDDLSSPADRILPFDYDHTGKQDHLLLYRPGSRAVVILRHGDGNTFTPVFRSSTGISVYDLASTADRIVPFDYDHTGKLDHLLLYRPGSRAVVILGHGDGNTFTPVLRSLTGIGGYDLASAADRVVPFDYDHTGRADHLLLYRPGSRTASVLEHGADGFTQVYASTTAGIGGYDLADARDQVTAFDYELSGRPDHLVLYRPGARAVTILRHGTGNSFTAAFQSTTGIGGYDLAVDRDQIVAVDFDHTGLADHLLLYRPGNRNAWIVGRQPQTAPAAPPAGPPPGTDASVAIVEDFSYPGAAAILASLNVRLISGDGHILLADCATPPVEGVGVIKVWTTEQVGANGFGLVCFKVSGPTGHLVLNVPGVYEIRGDGQQAGTGHALTAVVQTPTGPPTAVVVNPSGSTQVGIGTDPNADPTTLLELRVPS
jgi:Trypsin